MLPQSIVRALQIETLALIGWEILCKVEKEEVE